MSCIKLSGISMSSVVSISGGCSGSTSYSYSSSCSKGVDIASLIGNGGCSSSVVTYSYGSGCNNSHASSYTASCNRPAEQQIDVGAALESLKGSLTFVETMMEIGYDAPNANMLFTSNAQNAIDELLKAKSELSVEEIAQLDLLVRDVSSLGLDPANLVEVADHFDVAEQITVMPVVQAAENDNSEKEEAVESQVLELEADDQNSEHMSTIVQVLAAEEELPEIVVEEEETVDASELIELAGDVLNLDELIKALEENYADDAVIAA